MQKKLIALALASLAGTAFAQSNVTIYGVADVSFERAKAEGSASTAATGINQPVHSRVQSNSSLLGFKGAEDLGNGLKAVFQFESAVGLDGNASTFGITRDSYVGVSGGFGTVVGGHLSTPYRSALAGLEVVRGATSPAATAMNVLGKAVTTVGTAAASQVNTVTAARISNTVAYISPTVAGFNAVAAYSAGPLGAESRTTTPALVAGTDVNPTAYGLSLNYANGPIKAVYAYQDIKEAVAFTGASADSSSVRSQLLGGSFTFGSTTLSAVYDENRTKAGGNIAVGTAQQAKRTGWYVGAKHVVGAHEFNLGYARLGDVKLNNGASGSDTGANSYSFLYGFNLSKRTQAYGFYSKIRNDNRSAVDFTTTAVGTTNGADPQTLGVGVRHSF
jgi:predicted porin